LGTRTGEGRRADIEEERDFRSAEVPNPAAKADVEIDEAQRANPSGCGIEMVAMLLAAVPQA